MSEVNTVRHVLTFTSEEHPHKSHAVYGSLGDKEVMAKVAELSEAMKANGYPHKVEHRFQKTIAPGSRKPRTPKSGADPGSPSPEPAVTAAHTKPRAA